MTIDFGAHVYTESVFPEYRRTGGLGPVLGPLEWDPETFAQMYEDAGMDGAVVSQPIYMGSADVDAVAAGNDSLVEITEAYDQFYGLGAIPVAAGGEAAAEEFERFLDMGLNGAGLETKTDGIELTDEELEPVFEVADRTGAPIMVHPKIDDSVAEGALDDRWRLNAIFGREAALSESIFKVIHEGVLERYPNLNLVYHHLGGNISGMMGRIELQLDDGRWPGQEHVKSYEEFRAELEDRIYLDTSGFFGDHAAARNAMEVFPSSQILFGTDAPYEPRTADELRKLELAFAENASTTDANRILRDNALDLMVNVD
ncbi:MAG: amidohydrolase family protein [Halobacteriota archaeon]